MKGHKIQLDNITLSETSLSYKVWVYLMKLVAPLPIASVPSPPTTHWIGSQLDIVTAAQWNLAVAQTIRAEGL